MPDNKNYIIESKNQIDVVHTDDILAHRYKLGWTLVMDMAGKEWDGIATFAQEHAKRTGKRCEINRTPTEAERAKVLAQVYRVILGWKRPEERDG